ncbi:MAG: hypothetical protein JRJ03_15900 [Deltaproteobacteria bacterium]|nr:hypothetical protein [Deltaproteobacteria bacterium]
MTGLIKESGGGKMPGLLIEPRIPFGESASMPSEIEDTLYLVFLMGRAL